MMPGGYRAGRESGVLSVTYPPQATGAALATQRLVGDPHNKHTKPAEIQTANNRHERRATEAMEKRQRREQLRERERQARIYHTLFRDRRDR